MNLSVELISGRVCTVEVFPQMKITELQEKLKAEGLKRCVFIVVVVVVVVVAEGSDLAFARNTFLAPNHGCPLKIAKKEQQPPAFFTGSNWSTVT